VATLVIPSYNDSDEQLRQMADFIAGVDARIPWHVTAFHPTYKLTQLLPTPLSTLRRARQIGLDAGLKYVYTGNLPDHDGVTTRCPQCGATVIDRSVSDTALLGQMKGSCPACGQRVDGVWS